MEDILESIRKIVVAQEASGSPQPKKTDLPHDTAPTELADLLVEEVAKLSNPTPADQASEKAVAESARPSKSIVEEKPTKQKVISGYNPPKIHKIQIGGKSDLTMSLKAEQRRTQDPDVPNVEPDAQQGQIPVPTRESANTTVSDDADILDLTQLVNLESVESTKGVWVRDEAVKPVSSSTTKPSSELSEQRAYQRHLEDQIRQALNLENYVEEEPEQEKEKQPSTAEGSDDLSDSLDSYIRELVQERVQHWLDDSLEALVERIVREEIRAALKRPRK